MSRTQHSGRAASTRCRAFRAIPVIAVTIAALALSGVASLSAQERVHSQIRPGNPIRVTPGGGGNDDGGVAPTLARGQLVIPGSSRLLAADKGVRAHTNVRLIISDATPTIAPFSGYAYETPQSLACVYAIVTVVSGCNPNSVTNTPTGGGQTIAIVDAYDNPDIYGDLAYFSDQFGLPFSVSQFSVVYAAGYVPSIDYTGGWELEEALDVEWAHAMAPSAKIVLVEAASNSYADLFTAVQVATNIVRCASSSTSSTACSASATGKGAVSMSWGGSEFSGETSYDSYLTGTNVVYFASTGDSAGTEYPSVSPNVVAVGGTSIARSISNGNFVKEIAWSDAGSGISTYEARPAYQSSISSLAPRRAVPDVSSDANPLTGVWVYDSFQSDFYAFEYGEGLSSGWWTVGGTSVSAPTWAGILNNEHSANNGYPASTSVELTNGIYATLTTASKYAADMNDINYGACYFYMAYFAGTGYDLCTGAGSPKGLVGK